MNNSTTAYTNTTLYNEPWLCTFDTCPASWASVQYDPSLVGNALYLGIFSLVLVIQILLGVSFRTWSFLSAMIGGEVLEIIGYVARVQMHYNPFLSNPFLMYLIVLTIAPCFLSAGIYLCFSRIVVVYGEHFARFKPRTYTIIFISSDIFSLVLQAVGGALADTAPTTEDSSQGQDGINIMIAGLSCQVVSLFIFMCLCADFAMRVRKSEADAGEGLRRCGCGKGRFYGFLIGMTLQYLPTSFKDRITQLKAHFTNCYCTVTALALATFTIFVRSCFRVAELQGGFNGKLANQEIPFMILEGAMIVIASTALTVYHPGLIFRSFWNLNRARVEMGEKSGNKGAGRDGVMLSEIRSA